MKAVLVSPPRPGVRIGDIPEPRLSDRGIYIRILWTGICGTDREIINGVLPIASTPPGKDEMILGHEAIGVVERASKGLEDLVGRYVILVNRRGCGRCLNCLAGRADYCETGGFVEAGIKGLDGFMAEYVVDDPRYIVEVPRELLDVAVLAQPLSDLEKSIESLLITQRRMIWSCEDGTYRCRKAIVIGTGPIGMLASMLLKSYGFRVTIVNRRDLYPHEKNMISRIGVKFYNSLNGYEELYKEIGPFDIVFDTTAKPSVIKSVLRFMNYNSILALFGFARAPEKDYLDSEELTMIAAKNIALVGVVNGQKRHFETALEHIASWKSSMPGALESMITARIEIEDRDRVLKVLREKPPNEIKTLIVFSK